MKILKKGDYIIAVFILLISFVPLVLIKQDVSTSDSQIVVTQDSKVIGRYSLNKSENSKYIDFEFVINDKNYKGTLETKKSMVRLLRLPEEVVPKSIHADMSWISDDKKIIVALPAKLVVSIENSEKESDIDAIST